MNLKKMMRMRDSENALITKMEELKYEIEADTSRSRKFITHFEMG